MHAPNVNSYAVRYTVLICMPADPREHIARCVQLDPRHKGALLREYTVLGVRHSVGGRPALISIRAKPRHLRVSWHEYGWPSRDDNRPTEILICDTHVWYGRLLRACKPAIRHRMVWYRRGEKHRDNKPAHVECEHSQFELAWWKGGMMRRMVTAWSY